MSPSRDRLQSPLLLAFRSAFAAGDASLDGRERTERSDVEGTRPSRKGADESGLRSDLVLDLLTLLNTIDLASAVDLAGLDRVRDSVLNFGIADVSGVIGDNRVETISSNLNVSILRHEPRIAASSLSVTPDGLPDDATQKARLRIYAEMISRPIDVPVEFFAEIDLGSGKVDLSRS